MPYSALTIVFLPSLALQLATYIAAIRNPTRPRKPA